jgi:hypothetical protein
MATKKLDKPEEEVKEVKAKKEVDDEERVMVMVPYVEGQDPEVTVIINGEITKFRKGVTVKVKRNVAEVLQNSNQQAMLALQNQEKFKNINMDL